MQVLRLQPRSAPVRRLLSLAGAGRGKSLASARSWCYRGLHSGRLAPRASSLLLPRSASRRPPRRPGYSYPRLLPHGNRLWRGAYRNAARRISFDAERKWPQHVARHRGGNPGRSNSRRSFAQQTFYRAVAGCHHHRAWLRHPQHFHSDVRPHRGAFPLGTATALVARHPARDRGIHRVRASGLRPSEHFVVSSGHSASRPNFGGAPENPRPRPRDAGWIHQ